MDGEAGTGLQQLVRDAVRAEIGPLFDELRRFVDRRIAELSTEINATVELVDYSESNLSGQLQRMHRQLASVLALPAAATHNSGIELEAVVQESEAAANRIMSAAEAIRALAAKADGDSAAIFAEVNAIFEACAFQDLTGQRIRRALQHLQDVEGMIARMVEQSGETPVERPRAEKISATAEITGNGPDLAQAEIDKLLAG
jgi:chemotaxis protein CheZ